MFGNAEVELQTCTADPFDIAITGEVISQSTDADFATLDDFQDQEAEEHAIEKCKLFLSHFLDFVTQLIFHFLPQVPVSSKFLINIFKKKLLLDFLTNYHRERMDHC